MQDSINLVINYLRKDLNIPDNVNIEIEFTYDNALKDSGCIVMNNKNDYIIYLNQNNTFKEMVETLIHEMRHAYQLYNRILTFSADYQYRYWYGRKYGRGDYKIGNQPEEVDANSYVKNKKMEIYKFIKDNNEN